MADPNSSNVTRLVESHVYREIRGFRGNRLAVTKGIEAGLIPEEDVPGVAEHLVALRDDLAATGVDENDAFLLRFALTVPGMQRGIVCRTGARQVNPNQLPGTCTWITVGVLKVGGIFVHKGDGVDFRQESPPPLEPEMASTHLSPEKQADIENLARAIHGDGAPSDGGPTAPGSLVGGGSVP
ncbi:MAG: hypothetical protein ACLQGP_39085 [Isosphaeraceae bacterium]